MRRHPSYSTKYRDRTHGPSRMTPGREWVAGAWAKRLTGALTGTFFLFSVGAVVFYWSVEPADQSPLHTFAGLILCYLSLWGAIFCWSVAPRAEKVMGFFLASASLGLAFLLLELPVLARVVDFRTVFGTPVSKPWAHPGNLLDPTLFHIHRPYDHFRWWNITYRYDAHGLRNEIDLDAADVVVVGDSFIEGLGVPAADLVTAELARRLQRPVANLGQSWYGPQQELELLRRYGLQLRPRVCVWAFFEGNDLDDVHRYNEAKKDWEGFSNTLHSFRQRSFSRNALLAIQRVVTAWAHSRSPGGSEQEDISGIFEGRSGQHIRLYFWYKGRHLAEKDERALEELTSILREAQQLCSARGARFAVVLIPTKFRVYSKLVRFDVDAEPLYWVVNDLPHRLEAIIRESLPGAGFLDMTPALTEEASRGSLVYSWNDSHWSSEGHRVSAAAMASFLQGWLGDDPSAGVASGIAAQGVRKAPKWSAFLERDIWRYWIGA